VRHRGQRVRFGEPVLDQFRVDVGDPLERVKLHGLVGASGARTGQRQENDRQGEARIEGDCGGPYVDLLR
jgi:hypothetical protein